jgi:hypothetical protein
MLPIGTALGFTSPAGVFGEWTVRPAVRTLPFGSALRWVRLPATLTCSRALRLVAPTTMASADFCPDRSRQISPGKNAMFPCATAAFTSPGKPDELPLRRPCMCAPRRRVMAPCATHSLCCASSSCRIGLLCGSCSSARKFLLAFLPQVGCPS